MKFKHPLFEIVVDTDDLMIADLLGKLDIIYQCVPKTKCIHCPNKETVEADCCKVFSPPIYFIEFVSILKKIDRTNQEEGDFLSKISPVIKRSIDSFLYWDEKELIKPCALLDKDLCSFYNERPYSCRAFGLSSELEWQKKLDGIMKQTGLAKEEIPFYEQCNFVKKRSKETLTLSAEKSNELFDSIYNIDVMLFKQDIGKKGISYITYMPFDHHLLCLFLGPDNLEILTDMKILQSNTYRKYKDGEKTKEEFDKIREEVKSFAEILKENIK